MENQSLYDQQKAEQFYDERYENEYMAYWPELKRNRVRELIKKLPLPSTGRVLDFGCGYGVFSAEIKKALPNWEVWGSDLSSVAVKNAAKAVPGVKFVTADELTASGVKFDFIFSHHVIEHVSDLKGTAAAIVSLMNPAGHMLHILPCGNPGSFEHHVATITSGGINTEMENRFHYEDEGHLRRLTTDGIAALFAPHGFSVVADFYTGHYYGSLKTFYDMEDGLLDQAIDPSRAVNEEAKKELTELNALLKKIRYANGIAKLGIGYQFSQLGQGFKTFNPRKIAGATGRIFYYPFASSTARKYARLEENEWQTRQREKNGSEMFVLFKRG